ncbi:cyclic nucleotide-binding domain-containing protein [Coleofasciculus sp. G2-EDA-02]|uniref:cyclic nucleotide-binding domain-containing protein n=1 Tax=Coleofasciculus sp. G2-EDA-02 TaxID=3069529 RepID=UPI0032F9E733
MNVNLKQKEEFLSSLPLFQSLTLGDLEDILLFAEPFCVEANTMLFRQGEVAAGMYLLSEGRVRLYADVPGNDRVDIETVGSGDVIGEISVMDRGLSLTYALTLERTSGYFLSNLQLDMLRYSLRSSALNIMKCLRLKICDRIRLKTAQIVATLTAGEAGTLPDSGVQENKGQIDAPTSPLTLDHSRLQSLPLFRIFTLAELEEFLAPMRLWNLPRGHILYTEGSPADSCLITVRGAVRTTIYRSGKYEHLAVYGPSRLVGVLGLIDGGTYPTTCAVREQTTLLEVNQSYFETLSQAGKEIGFKFLHVVNQELALDLRKLILQITRLASQRQLNTRV